MKNLGCSDLEIYFLKILGKYQLLRLAMLIIQDKVSVGIVWDLILCRVSDYAVRLCSGKALFTQETHHQQEMAS